MRRDATQSGPLGDFLRSRRDLVSPEAVGLVADSGRQVPGLRREEVAELAAVSADYYARLEQGRERRPSHQVVDALASVLALDPAARRHLHNLAVHRSDGRPDLFGSNAAPQMDEIKELLNQWPATPAFAITRWLDIAASNHLAEALFDGMAHWANMARIAFLADGVENFVEDWPTFARCTVGTLRAAAAHDTDDPALCELVGELAVRSEHFSELWARHEVHGKSTARKRFNHRAVGALTLHQHVLTVPGDSGVQLWIYRADPGSTSEQRLGLLADRDSSIGSLSSGSGA